MDISLLELQRAYDRVRRYARKTPVWKDTFLDELWNAEVYLKCEQFQSIGAFKIRGASNVCALLSREERSRGIVTHSSGNHAQAVAYMAHQMGIKAWVVMPENANRLKVENARRWGAEIRFCKPTIEDRIRKAEAIQEEQGATMVPPFDHPGIVAGQATAAMELMAEVGELDYLVTPLGGGGLLAGSALAAKYLLQNCQVVGTEPDQASDGYDGFKSGKRVSSFTPNTVADGLRTSVGEVPFGIIRNHVHDIWLAKEKDIVRWMYRYWRETHTIIEPSSAVPLAALDECKERLDGKRIGIILTGGNVDINHLPSPE